MNGFNRGMIGAFGTSQSAGETVKPELPSIITIICALAPQSLRVAAATLHATSRRFRLPQIRPRRAE